MKEIERKDVNEVFQLRKANEALVIELLIPLLNQEMLHKLEEKDQQLFELKRILSHLCIMILPFIYFWQS